MTLIAISVMDFLDLLRSDVLHTIAFFVVLVLCVIVLPYAKVMLRYTKMNIAESKNNTFNEKIQSVGY